MWNKLIDLRQLDMDILCQIDAICDRFEEEFLLGKAQPIEEWVHEFPFKEPLIQELLLIELEHCLAINHPIDSKDYATRLGLHQSHVDFLIETTLARIDMRDDLNNASTSGNESTQEDPLFSEKTSENTIPCEGARIGRFELISVVGRGGFGIVWKAKDPDLDRLVALKLPTKQRLTGDQTARFLREARAAARLRHKNIVPTFEIGWDNGIPFIVADFIEGPSLADLVKIGHHDIGSSVEICAAILDGLHYAHEAGIVHRDVKPANVLIDRDQTPLLTDFGLSRVHGPDPNITRQGHVFGTPSYMSPEQARGLGYLADHLSDIYSVGVILYQLLTGDLPFRGSGEAVVDSVIHAKPLSPRSINPAIPKELDHICMKALKKRPQDRFVSAAEFAQCLRALSAKGGSKHPKPYSPAFRWISLIAGVILATATIAISAVFLISKRAEVGIQSAKDLEALAQIAIDKIRHENSLDALNELSAITDQEPRLEWICELAYGRIRISKDYDGAIRDCDKVLSINPQYPRAHYVRYLALRSLSRFQEAYNELNFAAFLGDPVAKSEKHELSKNRQELPHTK